MRFQAALFGCAIVFTAGGLHPDARAQPMVLMEPISGKIASTPGTTATQNILALNTAMFDLYGAAGQVFQQNIRANHPLILGMAETEKRGIKTFLPPPVPFGSHQWPTLITPGPGAATLAELP